MASTTQAIRAIERVSSFGFGPEPTERQMQTVLQEVERQHAESDSAELQFLLGIGWRNYTAWFISGDKRKPFLETAASHFERAYALERNKSGSKWRMYACEYGALIADEALIRDLDRAIAVFEAVFNSTGRYEPRFCS